MGIKSKVIHFLIALCLLSVPALASARAGKDQNAQTKATLALIKRVVPKHADQFEIAFIASEGGKDVFELDGKKGKIILRGNNGVSVASALHHYLKTYTNAHISWNGSNLNLPKKLPAVTQKERKVTPYKYRYYLNYCTFNYTMSWWDWERWQWEIDWMAMNGINMPLAVTGQNSIWDRVYKKLGFTDKDLASFYSGPAYFNWFWMGNLDGWGGPLPQSFMKRHEELQKQILEQERALGMTPILPAFTGHVPPAFKDKFPQAKLKKTTWQGFNEVYILDPDDPMFTSIGKEFIQEEINTFGTDHFYSADTFNENTPPTNDSTYLNDISKKVYQSMAAVDPKATWIIQGWMFSYSAKFWQPTQIQALLNAVPNDKMIVLDLYSESKPVWNRTDAYYGKPWIWCMLHNFGGNVSMYGRMNSVANGPATALQDPKSGNMLGIGLTPEAIEQNPVMYELMLENVWRNTPIGLDTWLPNYAQRRYGQKNAAAEKAWEILRATVYNGAIKSGGPESIITGRPTFNKKNRWTDTDKAYRPADLIPAWEALLSASKDLKNSEGFKYDLVDVTRQVLANYADTLQQQFALDYKNKDTVAFRKRSQQFLMVIEDMDKLLATHPDFLLGRWLNSAKGWGKTEAEKKLFEQNARNLITLWGDKNSVLHDYSCRQWAGMLTGFYKPRWSRFFTHVNAALAQGKTMSQKEFDAQSKDWEWQWVNGNETYPDKPKGNPLEAAANLYQKYQPLLKGQYALL